jgi:hypothetical protein
LFLNGAIGGWVQPEYEEKTFKRAELRGRQLGVAVEEALKLSTASVSSDINFKSKTFYLPVSNVGFHQLSQAGVIDRQITESFLIGQGINIGLVEVAPFFTPTGSFTKGVGLFNYLQQGAKIGLLKSTTQVSAQYLLGNSSNIDKADVVSTFIANTLLRGNAAGFTDELLKANFDYNRDFKMTFDGTKASGDAMIEFGVGLGLRNLNFLPKPVLGQTTNAVNQAANDVAVSVVKTTTKSAAKKAQPTGSNSTNND